MGGHFPIKKGQPIEMALVISNSSSKFLISNSNWTEWSTIQGVITRVISKSDEREADFKLQARLLPELYDARSNY